MNEQETSLVRPIDDRPERRLSHLDRGDGRCAGRRRPLGALISGSPQAPLARGMGLLAQEAVLAGLTVWRLKRLGVDLSALRLWIEDANTAWQGLVGGTGLLLVNIFGSQLSMLFFYLILGAERLTELWSGSKEPSVACWIPRPVPGASALRCFLPSVWPRWSRSSFSGVMSIPSLSNG